MKKYEPLFWVVVIVLVLSQCVSKEQETQRTVDDDFFDYQAEQALEDWKMEQLNDRMNEDYPDEDFESDGCVIKGNISLGGVKIYHVPGGEYYYVTEIDTEYGERWFCTEEEAEAAGWRKSLK